MFAGRGTEVWTPEDPETVATHCPYCALQCGTRLTREPHGVSVRPLDFPVNRGGLCQKGWTAPEVLDATDRLMDPMVRRAGGLVPVDWDTALDTVAKRIAALRAEHGADAVGVFGGGGLTNEKAYLLGKFARLALGTSQIDYNGRFCMSSAAVAGIAAFGVDRGLPFPVTDLDGADVVLLAGANPAETMPPLMQHLTGDLIVIDPRRTATAERAALHLQPAPGTDLALVLGLLHVAAVDGLVDPNYVAERTTGFDAAWRRALTWWPERVERVTGVPVASMRTAVRMLAEAGSAYVLTGRGVEQHSKGSDTAAGFINLALALGLPGRVGSGYGCLTGQGNGQGGREHGQKADQLPGYRLITNPTDRAHVADVWGLDPAALPGPGRSAYELLDALGTEDGPKALLVFGSNPVVSAPNSEHVTQRLSSLDLLVIADFVPSESARMADVVLPVTQWAEEDGTMTNLEGRVLRRRRLREPPGHARSDLEVLHGLAVRLGEAGHHYPTTPREVFEELRRASAGGKADYSGISYERLESGEALHWPCPDTGHPGTPRLFLDGFAHPDGRARFATVEHRDAAETPQEPFPLTATTGRVPAHYQSGAQTRRVPELTQAAGEAFVEVAPDTAERHGVTEGDLARVTSPRGSTVARVRLVPALRTDTVFLPFHFPGRARANLLTNGALDPRSQMPEFKVSAVRIEPAENVAPSGTPRTLPSPRRRPEMTRVVLVGNGLAAHRLVARLRELGHDGPITVLGEEHRPAYNRVLLGSVFDGTLTADAVTLPAVDAEVHLGVTATGIDRGQQVVHTDDGAHHRYDVLVLATGARPLVPEIPGLNGDHVRTPRTLADCQRIATVTGPIAVLGGGILGVETARALLSRGPGVTLVHPRPHPMDRRLDATVGRLLADRLDGLGVDLRLGRRPTTYRPGQLVLDNSDVVGADLVVVCTGVRPATGLAVRAGLAVRHGVVVDEQLRTSDPRIFAIGDCAEHGGDTPGLAAAAWEQADTLAQRLTGGTAHYQGARTAARLRARDIDLVSLGSLDELTGPEAETVSLSDPARGRYAKLALRGKRITGAVLLGFPQAIASITQLHDRDLPVPGDRLALLLGTPPVVHRDPVELPEDTVVCHCNNVTKKALAAANRRGACTVGELVAATRATTGCGACADDVRCLSESLNGAAAQESTT